MRLWFQPTALAVTFAAALLGSGQAAQAAITPVQSQGFSTSITQANNDWTFAGTATPANVANFGSYDASNASNILTFNQFDPSLGTLTGVSLIMIQPSITGTIHTGVNDIYFYTGQLEFSPSIIDMNSQNIFTTDANLSVKSLSPDFGFSNTVENSTKTGAAEFTSTAFTVTTGLASYIGLGSVSFTADIAQYSLSADCQNGCDLTSSAGFSGTLNLVYDYTPTEQQSVNSVPEPVSIVLVGSSLIALAAARRRREH